MPPQHRRRGRDLPALDLAAAGTPRARLQPRLYPPLPRHPQGQRRRQAARHPGLFDADAVRGRQPHEFDNLVTAPLHGFRDCDDYWRRASSKPHLQASACPRWCSTRNDPFLPAGHLPGPADVSPAVLLEQPAEGGHVGFVSGPWPGQLDWLPRRLVRFFTEPPKPAGKPVTGAVMAGRV
jgi:predicted alpha/beta-fold hydrolase